MSGSLQRFAAAAALTALASACAEQPTAIESAVSLSEGQGSEPVSYQWLLGEDFPLPGFQHAVVCAPNGDCLEASGAGTFTLNPKSVSGGGVFIHRDAAGDVVAQGTWEATELLNFHSYGPSPVLPLDWRAGRAHMKVRLDTGDGYLNGILRIDCALPEVKLPGSIIEGFNLAVTNGPNFTMIPLPPHGPTLFILQ